jgi:hypothetical protein
MYKRKRNGFSSQLGGSLRVDLLSIIGATLGPQERWAVALTQHHGLHLHARRVVSREGDCSMNPEIVRDLRRQAPVPSSKRVKIQSHMPIRVSSK